MLAYNFRKHNFQRSDHVREILAKIDAKQSKTGLSLYNQGRPSNNSTPSTPGGSPNYDNKTSFPSLKRARKKAKKRITTDSYRYQSNQEQYTRGKHIPHRLPSKSITVNLPPVSMPKPEERIQQPCSIPDQQFDKEKLDINLNPFGYNRKTLAFETRKINYVVEWPETWPFKITSFQGKKKTLRQKKPLPHNNASSIKSVSIEDEELPFNEPGKARVLAPVDHPIKQTSVSSKPYVESSLVKRGVRRPHHKEDGSTFVLKSRDKDTKLATRLDDDLSRNEHVKDVAESKASKGLSSIRSPIKPDISREQMDSCPPSTPVPKEQDPVPTEQDSGPGEKETHKDEDQSSDDLRQEASSLLNDIVNQIIAESKPLSI